MDLGRRDKIEFFGKRKVGDEGFGYRFGGKGTYDCMETGTE